MLRGIYTAASGMLNIQNKQDTLANNIANSETAGYKQDRIVTQSFPEVMVQNKDKIVLGKPEPQSLGTMSFGVNKGEVYTDFEQGPIQDTGNTLDFAINGRGFFPVQFTEGGTDVVKYTRDGSFSIDSDGMIVNADGGYLLARDAKTGQVGPIHAGESKVSVGSDGTVSIGSEKKYTLIINDFDDYKGITKQGRNVYAPEDAAPVELNPGQYQVKQGSLEGSNIDISTEMVNMITNLRAYQANQKVIQSLDETLGKAVNEIGALK